MRGRSLLIVVGVLLAAVALAACGGGGGSSDPTVLRAGQLDIKLPQGYKVVQGKVVDENATTTPASTAPATAAPASTSGSTGAKADATPTTKAGATATTKPSTTTIPLDNSSNPQSDMMSALGKFRACLDRDGVKFIGAPNQADPNSPTNDPSYIKSLSTCAAESNIVSAMKSAQSAQESLTPAQIQQQNKQYLKWRTCMIGKGWKIAMPKPDAQGRLVTFGTGSSGSSGSSSSGSSSGSGTGGIVAPAGKDLLTSPDLAACTAKVQKSAGK
jgi:hypothetical protein